MSTSADFDGIVVAAPAWVDVPQLSVPCVAVGGTGGSMNAQAVALTARTNYLAERISLLTGSGVPANTLGNDGDVYLDIGAKKIYGPKRAGAWPAGVSLYGAPGSASFTNVHRFASAGTTYWEVENDGWARIRVWGAGEGGEGNPGTTPTTFGRGGASGGYTELLTYLSKGWVITSVVGDGGAGGAGTGGAGAGGGDTEVTAQIGDSGTGPGNWTLRANGGSSHLGGTASGGDLNCTGEPARMGAVFNSTLYPASGSTAAGGGGTGGTGNAYAVGEDGHSPGGGGGGGSNGSAGGKGAPGMVEIWY